MKKVILFNAPPGAGKDFAAECIINNFNNTIHNKFAKVLKERTHALYGFNWRPHYYYEDCKEDPHKDFLGLSPRQAYIKVSETYFKPTHGNDVFGVLLGNELDKLEWDLAVISDSGFKEEAQVLINKYGENNIILVRVHREGYNFDNDSRNYISLPVCNIDIYNKGDESYTKEIYDLVYDIINSDIHT